jgi:hypothetical protein
MNMDDLEESLAEILPAGFQIETNRHGEVVIHTGLRQDDDGELVEIDDDTEEDPDFDPDFEPLEDEDQDEDE